ncbi:MULTISPECIES: beta-lactamase hydrolase domain-containing protein [Pacificibacter]|uniref:beta-lactamase hydrolase domain-containing protein n=1 Tax=Pacificibacter TaxID=1042323 RepID=UPI001C0814C7|nr:MULTISPECIES: sulfur transferase domain-containing protein [Pacificibacter]MBU2936248.1 hypothetical protein [Pacificibacter marinus]MDO6616717.1 sulfur transferase domain-containing protein [Pacificibacter sp. 1_MG-2023]
MRVRKLNGMFAIANQVEVNTVQDLAKAGYKTIICNRPNHEGLDQVDFSAIAAEAQKLGLKAVYLPIHERGATEQDQAAFDDHIFACPKPIVAFCRSGTRPAALWAKFDVVHNGGHVGGPERRVDAMRSGAMSAQPAASMAYAAGFRAPRLSAITTIGSRASRISRRSS